MLIMGCLGILILILGAVLMFTISGAFLKCAFSLAGYKGVPLGMAGATLFYASLLSTPLVLILYYRSLAGVDPGSLTQADLPNPTLLWLIIVSAQVLMVKWRFEMPWGRALLVTLLCAALSTLVFALLKPVMLGLFSGIGTTGLGADPSIAGGEISE